MGYDARRASSDIHQAFRRAPDRLIGDLGNTSREHPGEERLAVAAELALRESPQLDALGPAVSDYLINAQQKSFKCASVVLASSRYRAERAGVSDAKTDGVKKPGYYAWKNG